MQAMYITLVWHLDHGLLIATAKRRAVSPQKVKGSWGSGGLPLRPSADMKSPVTAPRLSWDELKEGLALGSEELLGKLSVRSVLSQSWEAGGVYPTLLGYALGAIATLAFLCGRHWSVRLLPVAACFFLFVNVLVVLENSAFAVLLAFAAIVGVGCTYIQVVSWQQAFAGIARRRKAAKKSKFSKVDKED